MKAKMTEKMDKHHIKELKEILQQIHLKQLKQQLK